MKCSMLYAALLLVCFSLVSPQSASAQCRQCDSFTIVINGTPNYVQTTNPNFPVISRGVNLAANTAGFVVNGTRNVVVGAATGVRNVAAVGANVIVAPVAGNFQTFSYVQPQYSSSFRHYQSGGPFTQRVTFIRFRR